MSSIRSQILDAIVTAWNTATPEGVPTATRKRFRQVVLTDEAPVSAEVFFVSDEEEADSNDTGPASLHQMVVGVELRAVGSESEIPEDVLDPSAVWAVSVLNDNALDGLAQYMRVRATESGSLPPDEVSRPTGKLTIALLVRYVSAVNDFESN